MGLGNGNSKSGNKGSNHNFEHRNLLSLGSIAALVAGGATEATLQLVLTAIQSGSEFEARLVEDALKVTWLEVRTWNTSAGTWNTPLYYPPGSNTPGTPTAPVVYINNSSVLATIAVNTTGLATQVTLAALLTELQLKADLTETQPVSAASLPLPTGAATETTQAANNVLLGTIDADTSSLATPTTGLAVSMLRVTGAGAASVAAGKRRVSFFNAGNADSTVAGATLKKGEIVSFSADGLRDTLAAISYDALTSELLITTVG